MGPAELIILMLIGVSILISIFMMALWIYSLVHAIQNQRLDSTMKLLWVLLIIVRRTFRFDSVFHDWQESKLVEREESGFNSHDDVLKSRRPALGIDVT